LPGCRAVVGELATIDRLAREIAKAGAIIHLASPRGQDRESVVKDDVLGTGALIDAWRTGAFIYTSSPTVHGVPRAVLKEDSPMDITCWYDMGKYCNEFQLRQTESVPARGPAISLRPALYFGANDRRHDRQMLSFVHTHCRLGSKFVFDSEHGLETYGSSYIGGADFGRAVCDALTIRTSGAYNVAGGFCTWRQLIEAINRHAGTRADFFVRPGAQPGAGEARLAQSITLLDTQRFAAETHFVPQESLDGLVETFVAQERAAAPSAAT